MNSQRKNKEGFTLIELLVVISIISILAGIMIPNMLNIRNTTYAGAARTFLRHCVTAMEMKRNQQGYVVNATRCDDIILGDAAQVLPSSVVSTNIIVNSSLSDYSVLVTSITGKVFRYENNQFLQGS